jgi:Mrp family chromosome partitioning ATPase
VLLDAAPIGNYPDPQIICPKVDGVIMVITAGKTRRQVAQRVKKEIEDAGGRILGVVINRRKYYIPAWIYKRL